MADQQQPQPDTFVLRPLEAADYHKGAVLSSCPFAHKTASSQKQALKVRGRLRVRVFDGQGCGDCFSGYLQLLQQLTVVGEISEEAFAGRLEHLQKLGANHHVAVIEDVVRKKIVATGSILVEYKFVRNCGKVGHIEDIVVDNSVRGQHLGIRIVEFLTTFAEEAGCYKVILDCSTENATFYEKCGLSRKGTQMAKYF